MTEAPFFHVGILVPNITVAIERFSNVLDIQFAEPTLSHVPQLDENGSMKPWDVLLTYSVQGPPHIELIQASGNGAYGAHHGYGLHHIGAWTGDCASRMTQMADRGLPTEAVFRDGDKNLGGYFDPDYLYGVRYEISPTTIRDDWKNWVHGGPAFMS